ncbi:MAG: SGNH/GDSL hydrolase family protein [Candidatus Dormibacteria bacterium]
MTDQPSPAAVIGAGSGPPAAVGTVLLALGDSIAAGIGASHVSAGCMAVLAGALRTRVAELTLVSLAIPGESSASMLLPSGQLERAEEMIAVVARSAGRVGPLTICLGGNDIMEAALLGDDEALRQFQANLGAILSRLDAALRATGSSLVEVGCIQTVYNPFEADVLPGGSNGAEAHSMAPRRAGRGGFNRIIRNAATARGIRLVEVSGLFRGRCGELTWVRSGDIHPTDDGHALIAEAYLEACAPS